MKESTKWKSAKWHSAVCFIFSLKFITPPFSLSLFFFYPFISCFYFQTPQFSLTVLSAAAALSLILSVASSSQSRLPRLVVGPFWGWNCTGGRPSVQLMRLCSGRLQAAMWSCRSCWEKFWCICAASWASMVFPQALFKSAGKRFNCVCWWLLNYFGSKHHFQT